jgi:hypothetical protein
LREKVDPTHILHVHVPLNMNKTVGISDYDAVKQSLDLVLSVSRAAYDNVICDDIQVEMEERFV